MTESINSNTLIITEPEEEPAEEEKIEDDEDDLSRIKAEIMKALSRLEQAEVE